jgi:SAM-dependent methyltransferase
MIWKNGELSNPLSGKLLERDSAHSLTDGENRFPVIDAIPFLRVGRDDLRAKVLQKLDAGDERAAHVLLFQDQDDWAQSEPPSEKDLQPLFENRNLNLREAMDCLRYGAVADYFAYRWSDPTFLSGLALLEYHLPPGAKTVLELACGIGHYLRELISRGIAAVGADVVFSKLWLARKFVAPNAKLICLDANFDFPFADKCFDAAFCHDAFYFLPEKQRVAGELKRTTRRAVLIGHAHNSEAENYSSGAAISASEYAAMFADSILYDNAELTRAAIEDRKPQASEIDELKNAAAIDLVCNPNGGENETTESFQQTSFFLPPTPEKLRINPLLFNVTGEIQSSPIYPSERYACEYAPLSNYLKLSEAERKILKSIEGGIENGLLNEKTLNDFARRRILLDLPEKW